MQQLDQIVSIIALSMGIGWASGINLYAAILTLGLLCAGGYMTLPPDLLILAEPIVIAAAGFMFLVEFVTDKIPGVDSGWDALSTFIRIPAGAILAAGAVGDINPALALAAAILGGALAAGTHTIKAGSRVMINTSPEPFSNWTASLLEDVLVVAGLWSALFHPWIFVTLLILSILLMIWLLPRIWKGVKKVFGYLGRLLGSRQTDQPPTGGVPPQLALPPARSMASGPSDSN